MIYFIDIVHNILYYYDQFGRGWDMGEHVGPGISAVWLLAAISKLTPNLHRARSSICPLAQRSKGTLTRDNSGG